MQSRETGLHREFSFTTEFSPKNLNFRLYGTKVGAKAAYISAS
jgi:hypothetical protein